MARTYSPIYVLVYIYNTTRTGVLAYTCHTQKLLCVRTIMHAFQGYSKVAFSSPYGNHPGAPFLLLDAFYEMGYTHLYL